MNRQFSLNVLFQRAVTLHQSGNLAEAIRIYRQLMTMFPRHPQVLFALGTAEVQSGNSREGIALLAKSLKIAPNNAEAHSNRGFGLNNLKRFDEALQNFDRAIRLKPDYAEAYNNRGIALYELRRLDEAVVSYDRAIQLKPGYAEAHNNRGNALWGLKRLDEALVSYDRAIQLKPGYAEAHNNRGSALRSLNRFDEALRSFECAIRLKPDDAKAHRNRGDALRDLKRLDEALVSYERAIQLDPDYAEAYYNRGQVLLTAQKYADAIKSFEAVLRINAEYPFAAGILLYAKMLCCDWRDFDEQCSSIRAGLAAGKKCVRPFGYQAVAESEEDLLKCAEVFATSEYPPLATLLGPKVTDSSGRVTIGYLCGEFREQATTILLCGVFEAHDKERFRLIAFDNGWDDGSEYRKRVRQSFDEMLNITRTSDVEAARLIRDKDVDILVNLNGYFGESRQGVFACRPSPIQVNYLGFPGTIGASYIDYLIADRVVIPESSRRHYSEKIVYLPNSYQANDQQRQISSRAMDRAEFGLPSEAFIYCCFNNTYKITPSTFDAWMRILKQVPSSVLWMLDDNPYATANLVGEAMRRGVAERRLIFASRMPLSEHLARHRLADLFLDTLPCNAHTTASDALWAGLPVLTRVGSTFPGRVAASLLSAIDLPELVTTTSKEYEALAVDLAFNQEKLRGITRRLAHNRLAQPLFDTRLFTKSLEAAYTMMFERYRRGLPPEHLSVSA